jgi:hypothetical protein
MVSSFGCGPVPPRLRGGEQNRFAESSAPCRDPAADSRHHQTPPDSRLHDRMANSIVRHT